MWLRRGVLTIGLFLLAITGLPTATMAYAQAAPTVPADEPTIVPTVESDLTDAHVAVWLCDDAKCPNPTQILADVAVASVDSASNQQVGSCMTAGDPAGCMLSIPTHDQWTFTWDAGAIPAGYVFDSVAVVTGGAWPNAFILQFVPDGPTEPEVETVHVAVMLCESADCVADGALLAGVGVASVNSDTNTQVDNCETAGDPAVCAINVPLYAPWTLTWDSTAIPDGYHFIGELAVVEGGAYPTVYLIRMVPDGDPAVEPTVVPPATKAPVTSLPKTGVGDGATANTAGAAAAMLAAVAGAVFVAACTLRRRSNA